MKRARILIPNREEKRGKFQRRIRAAPVERETRECVEQEKKQFRGPQTGAVLLRAPLVFRG